MEVQEILYLRTSANTKILLKKKKDEQRKKYEKRLEKA